MNPSIICPGKRLYLVLEAIDNPLVYKRIEEEANRAISYETLMQSFPNLSEEHVIKLYELATGEHQEYLDVFRLLSQYASRGESKDPVLNISNLLRVHVRECRGEKGCLDKFMLWAERKARAEMRAKEENEEGLPDLIRQVDFRTLDLGVF